MQVLSFSLPAAAPVLCDIKKYFDSRGDRLAAAMIRGALSEVQKLYKEEESGESKIQEVRDSVIAEGRSLAAQMVAAALGDVLLGQ